MSQFSVKVTEQLIRAHATPDMTRMQIYTQVKHAAPFSLPWSTFKRVYSGYVFKEARRCELLATVGDL